MAETLKPTGDPREEKLPRWARDVLIRERERATRAEFRLAAHVEAVPKSPIWYGTFDNPVYIPASHGHQNVNFSMTGERTTCDEIGVRLKRNCLEIFGGDTLSVEMVSSNRFIVHLRGVPE